jgi:DNA-binding response OmpR family regulator
MAHLLRQCGFAPRIARCGADALREAEADLPEVVLTELRLPDLDGCEVVRRMREGTCQRRPLFVALTTCDTDADRRRAAAAGVDLYMVKPAEPDALLAVLRRYASLLG